MTPPPTSARGAEHGLRRGLWVLGALVCAGTAAELVLIGHRESPIQLLPFGLCGLGLVLALLGPRASGRRLGWIRLGALTLVLGGIFGIWEHFEHNHVFASEIRPTADTWTLFVEALYGGSPLLAPGALVVAGLIIGLASWRHTGR